MDMVANYGQVDNIFPALTAFPKTQTTQLPVERMETEQDKHAFHRENLE
jgi:hypothetical protein